MIPRSFPTPATSCAFRTFSIRHGPFALVGRFFHSFDTKMDSDRPPRREIAWQGVIVEKRLRGHYLVQLFDCDWQFYDSDAGMRSYYEIYASRLAADQSN